MNVQKTLNGQINLEKNKQNKPVLELSQYICTENSILAQKQIGNQWFGFFKTTPLYSLGWPWTAIVLQPHSAYFLIGQQACFTMPD